ncbi:hypothetical protein HY440_00585 [Candidatus Microgenomates bacterium]|nr:hypothetical protein [Candidatus Microgenomates bacterium]
MSNRKSPEHHPTSWRTSRFKFEQERTASDALSTSWPIKPRVAPLPATEYQSATSHLEHATALGQACQELMWKLWTGTLEIKISPQGLTQLRDHTMTAVNFLHQHQLPPEDLEARFQAAASKKGRPLNPSERFSIKNRHDVISYPFQELTKQVITDDLMVKYKHSEMANLIETTQKVWGDAVTKILEKFWQISSRSGTSDVRYGIEAILAVNRSLFEPLDFTRDPKWKLVPDVRFSNLKKARQGRSDYQIDGVQIQNRSSFHKPDAQKFDLVKHAGTKAPYRLIEMQLAMLSFHTRSPRCLTKLPDSDRRKIDSDIAHLIKIFRRQNPGQTFHFPREAASIFMRGSQPWKTHTIKFDRVYLASWEKTLRQQLKNDYVPSGKKREMRALAKVLRRAEMNRN